MWLNDNPIAEPGALAEIASLARLKTIYLAGSPISKSSDYRQIVLRLAPGITQLDADAVVGKAHEPK